MGKVTKLKQRGDRQGLFVVLDNKNDWMLSLDAAEALVQLDDDRGLNYLIGALDDPKAAVRDVSREILEGLNNPEGNLALQSHPPGSIHSDPEEEHTDWLARLKYFKGIIVSRQKKTVWNFSLEWMIASALGISLRHMFFGILLYPLDFLESSESVFITKPVLAFVNSMWGEVSKNSVWDIFFYSLDFQGGPTEPGARGRFNRNGAMVYSKTLWHPPESLGIGSCVWMDPGFYYQPGGKLADRFSSY